MRRALTLLMAIVLLAAPCAAAELVGLSAKSLTVEKSSEGPAGHPCHEHAPKKQNGHSHQQDDSNGAPHCGADCLTWLAAKAFEKDGWRIDTPANDSSDGLIHSARTPECTTATQTKPPNSFDIVRDGTVILRMTQRLRI